MKTIYLDVVPSPKPRQTQRDKWEVRPAVARYRYFADELRLAWGSLPLPEGHFTVTFHYPMPQSWSTKKKQRMDGTPHQQRPDVKNLYASWEDALYPEDAVIWDVRIRKLWAWHGAITVDMKG